MNIDTIICKSSPQEIIKNIKSKISAINDIYLVDCTDEQVVILISDEEITEPVAKGFWLGWQRALE